MKSAQWAALAIACFGTTVLSQTATAAPAMNILFYGNSFTINSGDVSKMVGLVAQAAGQAKPNIENASVAGQTLNYHRTSNTAVIGNPVDFVETSGFQWDFVVLQEYSTKPTNISRGGSGLGNIAGFRNDAKELFKLVQSHSANVTPVMYQTWARHPNNTSFYQGSYAFSGASSYPDGAALMQEELRTSYALAQADLDALAASGSAARLAPVGDAFEAANWSGIYASDLYHQNGKGALLAALVIYETIFEDLPSEIPYATMKSYLPLSTYGVSSETAWADLTALSTSVVPEPSALAILILSTAALLRRRDS